MNQIKRCSIAGVSFAMEADAYERLSRYIESLERVYGNNPDGAEILADIEARIAELILSAQTAESVVALPLIENIIKQMGSAEQIEEEDNDHSPTPPNKESEENKQERASSGSERIDINGNPRIPRRLYRDLQNSKLGGVCAGLANYFDIDTTWVRLCAFAPLLLMVINLEEQALHGFLMVVLGYVVMWLAVPAASTARQKLEMKGERITAQSISENTYTQPDERERTLLAKLMLAVGTLLLICIKVVALFLLIGLTVGGSILILVTIITLPIISTSTAIGLSVLGWGFVTTLPIFAIIYLILMLLLSHKPNGKVLITTFIIWLVALVCMTISAIRSPWEFSDTINRAFRETFSYDYEIQYNSFTESEVNDFLYPENHTEVITAADVSLKISGDSTTVEKIVSNQKIDNSNGTISLNILEKRIKLTRDTLFINSRPALLLNDNGRSLLSSDEDDISFSSFEESQSDNTKKIKFNFSVGGINFQANIDNGAEDSMEKNLN